MHLLSSDKISFSMAIWYKVFQTLCFSSKPFLKQLASLMLAHACRYPSAKIPWYEVFTLIHPVH